MTVRAEVSPDGWEVRVFNGDRPVSGVVYNVSMDTQVDAAMQSVPTDLVDELMRIAQSDIERGIVKIVP